MHVAGVGVRMRVACWCGGRGREHMVVVVSAHTTNRKTKNNHQNSPYGYLKGEISREISRLLSGAPLTTDTSCCSFHCCSCSCVDSITGDELRYCVMYQQATHWSLTSCKDSCCCSSNYACDEFIFWALDPYDSFLNA